MAHVNSSFPLADTRQIARAVPLPSLMRHWGWRVHRGEKRADCGLCKGNSQGTVSLTDRLWKCHRCDAGGDAFAFVMQVQRCGFREALAFLADYASIPLPARQGGTNFRREIERQRQQRERLARSAEFLAELERSLRLECRERIHQCDRVLSKTGPWDSAEWRRAKTASLLRDEYLLPAYTLLSFGRIAERAQYVLADWQVRVEMAAAVRMAGGVRTDSGHWMEVVA